MLPAMIVPPVNKLTKRIFSRMKFLFPLKLLVKISQSNKLWVYGIFFLCIILATLNGYSKGSRSDPYVAINFVQPWSGFTYDMFVEIVKFLYTPVGLMLKSLLAFILFLFIVFTFSGVRKAFKYTDFILPFIGLAFFGIILRIISIILSLVLSTSFPYFFILCILIYLLIFYCIILVKKFNVNLSRGIFVIVISFLVVFFISGFPSVAPYLSWI